MKRKKTRALRKVQQKSRRSKRSLQKRRTCRARTMMGRGSRQKRRLWMNSNLVLLKVNFYFLFLNLLLFVVVCLLLLVILHPKRLQGKCQKRQRRTLNLHKLRTWTQLIRSLGLAIWIRAYIFDKLFQSVG
ncbi:unnamed protein product [Polarella glacialis]|uniref:Uncharacterized protein n=1 Tax=Polarella glacialis TaxID=89957 RepID=A0A813K6U9_POLGL|nr:unnamed protein product [Polarella glacialis]CAE8691577.1 unnamed protein product [Polarella glacialis]